MSNNGQHEFAPKWDITARGGIGGVTTRCLHCDLLQREWPGDTPCSGGKVPVEADPTHQASLPVAPAPRTRPTIEEMVGSIDFGDVDLTFGQQTCGECGHDVEWHDPGGCIAGPSESPCQCAKFWLREVAPAPVAEPDCPACEDSGRVYIPGLDMRVDCKWCDKGKSAPAPVAEPCEHEYGDPNDKLNNSRHCRHCGRPRADCLRPVPVDGDVAKERGMRFRKKSIVIQAMQFTPGNYDEACEFVGDCLAWKGSGTGLDRPTTIQINTLEGRMEARFMDWLIRGVEGEVYPCKPSIFEATYERELLPCPFCGGPASWADGEQKRKYGNEQIYCMACWVITPPDDKASAIAAWNRRAAPTPRQLRLEAAADAYRAAHDDELDKDFAGDMDILLARAEDIAQCLYTLIAAALSEDDHIEDMRGKVGGK